MPKISETGNIRVPCAYCRQTGRDRYGVMSPLSACAACRGKRFHLIATPVVKWAYYHGSGASPTGTRSYCLACGGQGIQSRAERTQPCPDCHTLGAQRSTGLYCQQCHGAGMIRPQIDPALSAEITDNRGW